VVSQVCRSCLHISTANEDYDQDLELADILVCWLLLRWEH